MYMDIRLDPAPFLWEKTYPFHISLHHHILNKVGNCICAVMFLDSLFCFIG